MNYPKRDNPQARSPDVPRNQLFSFLVFAAFILLALFLGNRFVVDESALRRPLASLPLLLSGALFVSLYICVTFFLWFSKDVFRLVAALAFGPVVSTVLVWLGEMGNCWILFRFARRTGKGMVERSLPGKARGLYEGAGGMGFGWLLLLRCAPVLPFRFLDLGAGLSSIPFGRYFAASCLGSPLRIFWLQLVLAGAGAAAIKGPEAIADYFTRNPGVLWFGAFYLFFMMIAFILIKTRERLWR